MRLHFQMYARHIIVCKNKHRVLVSSLYSSRNVYFVMVLVTENIALNKTEKQF